MLTYPPAAGFRRLPLRLGLLLGSLLLVSCGRVRPAAPQPTPPVATAEPLLLFATYRVVRQADGNIAVEEVELTTVAGQLKPRREAPATPRPGDLTVLQLSAEAVPLDSITVANPLHRRVEYAADDGTMTGRTVSLDSATFSVRLQRHPLSRYLVVRQQGTSEPLTTKAL